MGHDCCAWSRNERTRAREHPHKTWAIVLSGGDGTRMQPFIQQWLGEDRPKQYCTFVGNRSMLEHTQDRAARTTHIDRFITVVGRGHGAYIDRYHEASTNGRVLEQPQNLGTAPGIFVPAAHVLEDDPEATILIYPSDHFVYPEPHFVEHVSAAVDLAARLPDHVVILGAEPDGPEPDYGYIALAHDPDEEREGHSLVEGFYEKPTPEHAAALIRHGALWNTMVCAVRAETLWRAGWDCLPAMMEKLERYRYAVRAVREGRAEPNYEVRAFMRLYSKLQPLDFSKHVLQRIPNRIAVRAMHDVHWSDWGRPERVAETIARIGGQPAFDTGHLQIWRPDSEGPEAPPAHLVRTDYWVNL